MQKSPGQYLLEKTKEPMASKAALVVERLELLKLNFYVYQKNYVELEKILSLTRNQEISLSLWDTKNRQRLIYITKEICRLLHNYVTSAKSLNEHTRVSINAWFLDTEFYFAYQNQKDQLIQKPIMGFIEKLRDYSLHYSLPITTATLRISSSDGKKLDKASFSFVLNKAALLKWDSWKKGKQFLLIQEDDIDIILLVQEYHSLVVQFHDWLQTSIETEYFEELSWQEKMENELFELMNDEEKQAYGYDDPKTTILNKD